MDMNVSGYDDYVETQEVLSVDGFDFSNEKDDQGDIGIEDISAEMSEAFDDDSFDFSMLDDVYEDDATSPTQSKDVQEDDEEDVDEFEAEQAADLLDTVEKVSDSWDRIPEDMVVLNGMTKAEVQTAITATQENSQYNQEFVNFKAHVEKGYDQINTMLYESMSETDVTLRELYQKKSKAVSMEQRGAIDAAIEKYEARKNHLRHTASGITNELSAIKQQVQKQEMMNFVQEARRAYGTNWEQELNDIGNDLPEQVNTALRTNPSVELFNLIRDAKAYRARTAANKEAVKNAGKKTKSAKSMRSSNKGTKPVHNRKKLEAKLEAGHTSDSDVFAALID
ncbi:hypothetical protein CGI18_07210 [Vibrio parahaemolyticus]|uniref:hypothetical protein n=1 Tax=Vibrio parahaemolyticus TaxID=670 RepID=UPI001121B14F|nr:hypothetical protein [Vibrio parahaemolyticus]TOK48273.1 hypothetical protein CGI18_07210 [Vibrio parahaemolyticus]